MTVCIAALSNGGKSCVLGADCEITVRKRERESTEKLPSAMNRRGFGLLLTLSLFFAILNVTFARVIPEYGPRSTLTGDGHFDISLCITAIWASLVLITLMMYGKRGLWLLIGMPFALLFPVVFTLIAWGYIRFVI
jgi:hypothetical protein